MDYMPKHVVYYKYKYITKLKVHLLVIYTFTYLTHVMWNVLKQKVAIFVMYCRRCGPLSFRCADSSQRTIWASVATSLMLPVDRMFRRVWPPEVGGAADLVNRLSFCEGVIFWRAGLLTRSVVCLSQIGLNWPCFVVLSGLSYKTEIQWPTYWHELESTHKSSGGKKMDFVDLGFGCISLSRVCVC